MKKRIAVSVGLVAIGTSAIQAVAAEAPKPWTVSASLKGFYDDNYTTSAVNRQESTGFEISPSLALNLAMERTLIVGQYVYRYNWYSDRSGQNLTPDDQSHVFNIDITQTISERLTANVGDQFVMAQEPELLNPVSNPAGFPGRANGDNIRNSGYVGLNAILTQLFSGSLSYANTLTDYEEEGGNAISPSRSGLLDRDEHQISAQLGWLASPTTTFFVGYSFSAIYYTGDEVVAQTFPGLVPIMSSARNSDSHLVTVGFNYAATETLRASLTVGGQYTDYYNDPTHPTSLSPYLDGNLSYVYARESTLKLGVSHSLNATDQVQPDSTGRLTTDQESTAIYLDISHQLTPKLTAGAHAVYQASVFNGGLANDQTDHTYSLGFTLRYALTEHFNLEGGYVYDKLDSDLPGRDYYRNRFNLGVSATY